MTSKGTIYSIAIFLGLALLIYAGIVIWAYDQQKLMFAPYVPPPLTNGWQPGGPVSILTPAEQSQRRSQLTGNAN